MQQNNILGDLEICDPTNELKSAFEEKIHLRIQKRNARKAITTIEGLTEHNVNQKKLLAALRKKLCCNGSLKKTEKGEVIIVQGDHRDELSKFLKQELELKDNSIVIHGF